MLDIFFPKCLCLLPSGSPVSSGWAIVSRVRGFWRQNSSVLLFWLALAVIVAFSAQTMRCYAEDAALVVCAHPHTDGDDAGHDEGDGATPCSSACHVHHGTLAVLIESAHLAALHTLSMRLHLAEVPMPDAPVREVDYPPQLLS